MMSGKCKSWMALGFLARAQEVAEIFCVNAILHLFFLFVQFLQLFGSETFITNPQYAISLPDAEPGDKDGLSVCIMSVLQKDRRERRNEGVDMLPIGFAVYHVR